MYKKCVYTVKEQQIEALIGSINVSKNHFFSKNLTISCPGFDRTLTKKSPISNTVIKTFLIGLAS